MSELVDKDAFLKQERKWHCENCDMRKGVKNGRKCFVYEIGEAPCRACDVDDVLDDLECFETIAAPRWVRVEDELPYKNTDVLLYDEHGYFHNGIMSRFRGYTEFIDYDGNTLHGITHWMPLPEPPGEEV